MPESYAGKINRKLLKKQRIIAAAAGREPADLVLKNATFVNVFSNELSNMDIAVTEGLIVGMGSYHGREEVDCTGRIVLPGFLDAHIHLESSLVSPTEFVKAVLPHGTTTVVTDPHEIANVLGIEGVRGLADACRDLPLRVLLTAPSTVPSAPGLEDSGFDVGPAEMEDLLDIPGVAGLGEVMDFNAVAAGDERMLSVIEAAASRGVFLDGHVSALTGRRLQIFRAMGIDSDHTTPSAEKLREELALGFTVQVQECMLSREIVQAMNDAPVQDRICLVTDDVPLPRLMRQGHLNFVVERAIELGLDPIRAIRYATINPAVRLRLYRTGGIAPGMEADMQLVQDLRHPRPELVLRAGEIVWDHGSYLPRTALYQIPDHLRGSVHLRPVTGADFAVRVPVPSGFSGGTALVNLMGQDGTSIRTHWVRKALPLSAEEQGFARLETAPYLKMAVFNRYGRDQHGIGLLTGMDGVTGAAALTYGHDCHNLTVYGGNDADMALAANTLRDAQGGLCTAENGKVLTLIPLPLAGLMCDQSPEALLAQMEQFLADCRRMGFTHKNLLTFFTLMPLAVSPELKCTDRGLVDALHKRLLPLIEEIKEISSDGT